MLKLFLDFLPSLLSGGVTGLLGTAITAGTRLIQRRQDHRYEMELRRLDMELASQEAARAERAAAVMAKTEQEKAAWAALEASYRHADQRWSRPGDSPAMRAVDVFRGLVRPGVTVLLLALVGAIYFTIDGLHAASIRVHVVQTILYLATTTVMWWFGARQVSPPPKLSGK
ncbi:MAG: hypothetical protein OXC11_14485 [Rhodospirillales bacterium]|nr:hypothetical protein [Rhodospirillales bacterium]